MGSFIRSQGPGYYVASRALQIAPSGRQSFVDTTKASTTMQTPCSVFGFPTACPPIQRSPLVWCAPRRTAARDGVTTEMLASLNEHHVETLHRPLLTGLRGLPLACTVHPWLGRLRQISATRDGTTWQHGSYRNDTQSSSTKILGPISIIPVLKKLYVPSVATSSYGGATPAINAPLVRGMPSRRLGHRTYSTCTQLVEKCVERGLPLYAAKLDVKAAFESMPLMVASTALERAGADPEVTDAYVKELLSMDIGFKYVW